MGRSGDGPSDGCWEGVPGRDGFPTANRNRPTLKRPTQIPFAPEGCQRSTVKGSHHDDHRPLPRSRERLKKGLPGKPGGQEDLTKAQLHALLVVADEPRDVRNELTEIRVMLARNA